MEVYCWTRLTIRRFCNCRLFVYLLCWCNQLGTGKNYDISFDPKNFRSKATFVKFALGLNLFYIIFAENNGNDYAKNASDVNKFFQIN